MRVRRLFGVLPSLTIAALPVALLACASGASMTPAMTAEPSAATDVNGMAVAPPAMSPATRTFDVKDFGATGDGQTIDTDAINEAIDAAAAAGGGVVHFSPGTYASYSIHLKSNVSLYLDQGATLLAAESVEGQPAYDAPEPNATDMYQDFGHSHFHNSLIWGENVHDVAILGPGTIDGDGLSRNQTARSPVGTGNKSIALKLARNVLIRDITIYRGGHFGILATGVDNMTIDNIKIDTNRDGIDVDGCRNVRISNASVNSPNDDAIVLKTSYALGFLRPTENVTITNSLVSGYDVGSLLDGTFKHTVTTAPDRDRPTGRIKLGTESNGDFLNITISNIVFDYSRGLALETVDGSHLEDISASNLTMRHSSSSPIFIRLGRRMRAPEGMEIGTLKRVNISNVVAYDADPRFAADISGIPGHEIEDVKINNVQLYYRGGGTAEQATVVPPENEDKYPEPSMFGTLPAYGFYIRHVDGLELNNVEVHYQTPDQRPAFILNDVQHADFNHVKADHEADVPTVVLKGVEDFDLFNSPPLSDTHVESTQHQQI